MKRKVAIYCLIDPRNEKPFYVGATIDPLTRLAGHRSDSTWMKCIDKRSVTYRKGRRIKAIIKSGKKLVLKILKWVSINTAFKWEMEFYVKLSKEGNKLLQMPKFSRECHSNRLLYCRVQSSYR